MLVACSTLCFMRLSLADALQAIRDLRFAKADLSIRERGPHLKPSEVGPDVGKAAQRLRASNVAFAAFEFEPAEPNAASGKGELRAVCRLARSLSVPVVTVAAAPAGSAMNEEVARLTGWSKVAAAEGVILCVETHADTLTASPQAAAMLCQKVPGLGLTLDPSHYLAGPDGPANYDALFPYVRHTRLRDSAGKPGQFQVRVGQGELEYGRIVTQLDRCKYDRALSVDVRDLPEGPFPVEPEIRKLKYLLESLV